jgi:RimJ/RimL family protein N-acetyltransferase
MGWKMSLDSSPDPFKLCPSLNPCQNEYGLWVGKSVLLTPPHLPNLNHQGQTVGLRELAQSDHGLLFDQFGQDTSFWTYMPIGPFSSVSDLSGCLTSLSHNGFHFIAITPHSNPSNNLEGFFAFMRQDATAGIIEIGSIALGPTLKQTRPATEALYLAMRAAFEAGYRRLEWKCDQLNIPSIKAALRLGFQFEGVFRNASFIKGRRRDTAWFSVIAEEWPKTQMRLEKWIDNKNFDSCGKQIKSLSDIALA